LKKILVVSKDANVVSLLKLGLGKDYEVSVVGINEEGILKVISEKKSDLIILEIVMPQAQEIIVGLRIRKESETPMIMLTVFDGAVRIIDLKGRDYLGKKLTAPELKQRIEEGLQR